MGNFPTEITLNDFKKSDKPDAIGFISINGRKNNNEGKQEKRTTPCMN